MKVVANLLGLACSVSLALAATHCDDRGPDPKTPVPTSSDTLPPIRGLRVLLERFRKEFGPSGKRRVAVGDVETRIQV